MTHPSRDDTSTSMVCRAGEIHHRYGDTIALRGVDLATSAGEIVALLGPNGSGKSTLFRLLCTLMPIQRGTVTIAGVDAARDPLAARRQIGIVFQSPSLDKQLTVAENMACQAALYGIRGEPFRRRRDELLRQLELTDRRDELCGSLSGGLRRRVELAKGMLHRPKLLLLDEPSTGLDPTARLKLWTALRAMAETGMSILLTTHLLEEADKADRVSILDEGRKIAEGPPSCLRRELGEGVVTVESSELEAAETILRDELGLQPQRVHHQLKFRSESPERVVPRVLELLGERAQSVTIGRPTLEDVFVAKTGHRFE